MRRGAFSLFVSVALLALGCQEVGARRDLQEGNKLYYAGKYEQSVVAYEKALAVKPALALGWYNLGLAHLAMFAPGMKTKENEGHAQGAIHAFLEYMKTNAGDTKARDYLLSTYIDSGHYEGALAYFEKQLEKNPGDLQAVAQLAQINAQAGKFEDATRWHKKRVELETAPDAKADAWYAMGVLSWRALSNHLEVTGNLRAKIADQGIFALEEATKLRSSHQATMTYLNLLYRERALAHEAVYARAVDLATAQFYYAKANALAKVVILPPAAAKTQASAAQGN